MAEFEQLEHWEGLHKVCKVAQGNMSLSSYSLLCFCMASVQELEQLEHCSVVVAQRINIVHGYKS